MQAQEDIEAIRDALVHVVAEWTQGDLQVRVAESIRSPLDAGEVRSLYLLGMSGGSLGFGELAERGALSRPTTSKLVSRMSARGLFDRVRSGRTVEVRLTEAGVEAYARLVAAGQQMVGGALTDWTPEEITRFQSQLTRFVAALPRATLSTARRSPSAPVSPQEET
ncbi:MarR family winged helix-turn-helix transcriptional regulator [Microbacterium sp. MYb62]|uniref:MarR family winged helix-turn-helix transcriptional regulator n=1 Tax=Microbacterium sp. MYb62 TaxID=1848690 RepID=UPI000CFD1962|nr:MarR family winged helix-turn-helix transcriptional regulator [Microbacterium sp. MYb62]PRB18276.1 MarR family transcriptional regulator [Microbacterium sp. MYb62]